MKKIGNLKHATKILKDNLLKIAYVNLTNDYLKELHLANNIASSGDEHHFSKWTQKMIRSKYVFMEDMDSYSYHLDLKRLRTYFETNQKMSFRYRQLINSQYRFVCLQLIKAENYRPGAEYLYLYINDINDIQSKENEELVRLRRDTQAAEDANRSKSEFLSRMSHDIRNPLNVIMGLLSLCKTNIHQEDKLLEYIERMNHSAEFLLSLINDALDVSKIESRKLYLKYVNFKLDDFIEQIAQNMETANVGQKIIVSCDLIHPNVLADKDRIQQIINNLLSNSCKYVLDKSIPIEVHVKEHQIDQDTSNYRFDIIDHGMGMSKEILSKLFVPYERGVDSRINKIQGFGLGMSICKSLIELMNGTIHVQSKEEMGTTMTVYLPLKHSKECIVENPVPLNKELLKDKYVLVAEDYPINRMILEEFLKSASIRCDFACDGKEALKQFEENHYDAILMDIQMPNMDGYEATKSIRQKDRKIPIIAISADAFNEDVVKMVECGMNDHISKPIEQNKLLSVLTKYI